MSVTVKFRTKRKRWQVDYYVDGKRHRPLFIEEKEARNFARKIALGLRAEDKDSITIADASKKYFETESSKKVVKSRANDRRYLNLHHHFMDYERGITRLKTVELDDMEAFRDWLPIQTEFNDRPIRMKASTINRCLRVLKHFYRRQIQWKNIKDNPCEYLEYLDANPKQRACMNREQLDLTLGKVPGDFIPALTFMYLTGNPASCVERLNWDDVDLVKRQYFILRKKGRKAKWKRTPIAMGDEVFALLVSIRNQARKPAGPVFLDSAKRPLLADRITRAGNDAIKEAGIEDVTLYGLRHALASDLTEANVATEIVRQVMAHGSIETTQGYANKIGQTAVAKAINLVRGAQVVPK